MIKRGVNMFTMNEQKAIELGEAGIKAASERNEYDAIQNIDYLKELGEELIKADLEKESKMVAVYIRNIGTKAAQKRFEEPATAAIEALKELSEMAIEKSYSNALWSLARAVQEVGKGSAHFKIELPAKRAVEVLEIIGLGAVEKKMEVVTLWTTLALEEIDFVSNEQELPEIVAAARTAREAIIKSSEEKGFVSRQQIEVYPKLIYDTIKNFGGYQDLRPSSYQDQANEAFTEEEFFEGEAENEDTEAGETENKDE